ncbi:bacteriophage abortive infection AbiH family protein [Faecalimonas sp.]
MNILIIGNGFDLAHGLPTKYEHFLEFVNTYENHKETLIPGCSIKSEWGKGQKLEKDFLVYLGNLCNQKKELFEELVKMISENVWLDYFISIYKQMQQEGREGWIDFESEISNIVREFDSIHLKMLENVKKNRNDIFLDQFQTDRLEKFIINSTNHQTLKSFALIKINMLNDLNRLIRALEIYLSDFVNNYPINKKLSDIEGLEIDKVLSFNYTNTYKRIYGNKNPDIEYDYIHGKADIKHDKNSCNLVLGIDEYLDEDEKNKNTEFIQFKKYFQRIYKKTGCEHVDWLNEHKEQYRGMLIYEENYIDFNVYIFGHSLDITDKDIIAKFIQEEHTQTTIFHFNQQALGSQIANLVKVIGQDNLISMVHGINAKIILWQQQEAKNIEDIEKEGNEQ